MGNKNAPVFPVPVCAQAIKSLPFKINGIACVCIGVAFLKPIANKPSKRSGLKLKSLKSNIVVVNYL
jgi:hypothetical protein